MISFPMDFPVRASAAAGIASTWSSSVGGDRSLTVAIPPEFNGPGGGYSPEDLFALALANCFIATFTVVAEKSRLAYTSIHVEGRLVVDRNEKGIPGMADFYASVVLAGAVDTERAQRILEKTSENCMILNSVLTRKHFDFRVSEN